MAKTKFYGVAKGRTPGIYSTWAECQKEIKGFSKAIYKSFSTKEQAEEFIRQNSDSSREERSKVAKKMTTNSGTSASQQKKFYAVARGRNPGIYTTWTECQEQTAGVSKALYKTFPKKQEAEEFLQKHDPNKRTNIFETPNTTKKQKLDESLYITLYFDGGSRGNGKVQSPVAGSGTFLSIHTETNEKSFREELSMRQFLNDTRAQMTNNYAEYMGLVIGLREAKKRVSEKNKKCGVRLEIKGDSLLVMNQMTEANQCRNENIKPLYDEAMGLAREIRKVGGVVEFEHVYRENNSVADGLANEAMDEKRSWTTSTCTDHKPAEV